MDVVALTFETIYSHCHIRLNISSENNDFGFNSIHKINISKRFTFRYNRKPRSTKDHHLNKLGRPYIPNAAYQYHRPSGSGEEDF